MAVLDHGVNLAVDKVDAGQQGDHAVALVFMVGGEGRMNAGVASSKTFASNSPAGQVVPTAVVRRIYVKLL